MKQWKLISLYLIETKEKNEIFNKSHCLRTVAKTINWKESLDGELDLKLWIRLFHKVKKFGWIEETM